MTLSSLFIVCSHGRRSAHGFGTGQTADVPWHVEQWCPGGRPATLEDLGGEKVWWCWTHGARESAEDGTCEWIALYEYAYPDHGPLSSCDIVERILIPHPQMVAE